MPDNPSPTATLKPFTQYRCTNDGCGKASRWTGAMTHPTAADDRCPACGGPFTEVVDDGHTYRVSWEMVGPHSSDWHPVHRDHTDRQAAVDQYKTLAEWERTGAEQVRSVDIARSQTVFASWDPNTSSGDVGLLAYWNDDHESWWFDTGDADDAADTADRFYGLVPADLWAASRSAYKAWTATMAALETAMGLGDGGRLEQICPAWAGRTIAATPYVRLVVALPNGSTSYFGGHDSVADAEAVLADLPDVVYVLAWGKPTKIARSAIKIETGEHGGYETACYRCGHDRADHAPSTGEGR